MLLCSWGLTRCRLLPKEPIAIGRKESQLMEQMMMANIDGNVAGSAHRLNVSPEYCRPACVKQGRGRQQWASGTHDHVGLCQHRPERALRRELHLPAPQRIRAVLEVPAPNTGGRQLTRRDAMDTCTLSSSADLPRLLFAQASASECTRGVARLTARSGAAACRAGSLGSPSAP